MSTDLAELIRDRVEAVPVPPGDLEAVHRAGHRLRFLRTAPVVAAALLLVCGLGFLLQSAGTNRSEHVIEPMGRLDFSQGLRAYADPGRELHLGGRTFPAKDLEALDTDAAATPYGVVFYDAGRPFLLGPSGEATPLEPDADRGDFAPTAKADAVGARVAYGAVLGGHPTVVVRDLDSDEVVASHVVAKGTTIDALDDGVVFLRTDDGTTTWDTATDEVVDLAGPETRVADVRNGVLLYDGPAPAGPGASPYRLVAGAVDAQLTLDGGHVLYWSSRLESTDGGDPIVLEQGEASHGTGYGWWTVDTDGSILAAVPGKRARSEVYDCEVPSGTCEDLGPLRTSGDPMFIGDDM